MKRLLLSIVLFLSVLSINAGRNKALYFVYLHDKANTPYSFAAPLDFLSQRAIDRRTRFNIPLDSADLPVNPSYISQIISTGATFYHSSRWMNGVMVYASNSQLQDIIGLSFVDSAEMIRPAVPLLKPKKRKRNRPVSFVAQALVSQNVQIGVDSLHNAGYTGRNIQIAVIDAGFPCVNTLPCFDSLRARGGILGTYDFVHDTAYAYAQHYHGTLVLSTMAANLPNEFVGSAPDADYWLFISEEDGEEYLYESDLLTIAFEAADSVGADIATASLGYFFTDDENSDFKYSNMDGRFFRCSRAATMAAERGMILCLAAGNEGDSEWHYIGVPADADSILCIGGVDAAGDHSKFSSYGPSADGRIKPEVCARATFATVVDPYSSAVSQSHGTSFATPISAGAIASLISAFPDVNPAVIRSVVCMTASQAATPDNDLGYGILNVWRAYLMLSGKPASVDDNRLTQNVDASFDNGFLSINDFTGPVSVYDLTGKLVYSGVYTAPVVVPNLTHGVYLLQLPSGVIKLGY